MPFDRPRAAGAQRGERVLRTRGLEEPLRRAVTELARKSNVPVRAVLLAALAAVLYRYSGDSDLVVAVADDDDDPPALADMPERRDTLLFTTIAVTDDPPFAVLLERASRALVEPAARVPLANTAELRATLPDRDHGTLAHAGFTWRDGNGRAPARDPWSRTAGVEIALECGARAGLVTLALDADAALFDPPTVDRMLGHLTLMLAGATRAPDTPIAAIDLVTPEERARFAAWNDTAREVDERVTVVELIQAQMARAPEAPAVFAEEGDGLTYGELEVRANRLAHHLRTLGVGPEEIVAIFLDRSVEGIVAVIATHRAGGAYLPVDPGLPRERIEFMLADAGARVVITQERLRAQLPEAGGARVVSLDGADADAIATAPASAPPLAPDPARLAYLIYTSGSTGTPKAVEVAHGSVVNFLSGLSTQIPMRPDDRLLALAPLSFDISVLDMFHPLTSGARLIVVSRETATDPRALIAVISRRKPTVIQATPSSWRMLVDAGWEGRPGLTALSGGEALPEPLANALIARGLVLWNLYGPTEATVWATMQRVHPGEPVRIGAPMPNVTAHVLDGHRRPAPIGIAGELWLGGRGLARGYRNRPELTAQRFVEVDGVGRLYRTGDLARWTADGTLECLGRTDHQVKLRGHRVELGEIEATLAKHPEVRSAAVIVREDSPGDPRLVGYVVVDVGEDVTVSAAELRTFVRGALPSYMVPDAIVLLDALPLNTNGKIDRKRLPAPAARRDLGPNSGIVAPRTPTEQRLVAIWEEVLDVRPIGVTDDFFDLGATSITAARLFQRIEEELGTRLPLSPLFQAPTVEKLAALVERQASDARLTSLVAVQPHGTRTPVFCVHGGAGTVLHFQPLARRLGPEQPFYGLQMQGLYGDGPIHTSIRQMARHYVREIRCVQPHGPYILAGYCFGGLVALEMAQRLERAGERVALLFMINAALSSRNGTDPSAPDAARPGGSTSWTQRAVLAVKRVKWALEPDNLTNHLTAIRRWWRGRQLYARVAARSILGRPLPEDWRERGIYFICQNAERVYRPAPWSGDLLLFSGADLYDREDLGWRPLVRGRLTSVVVPGEHTGERTAMREPYVGFVAERLAQALAEAT